MSNVDMSSSEADMGAKNSNWKIENNAEEESKCLDSGGGDIKKNDRFRAMFGRFQGNTVLSTGVRTCIIVLAALCMIFFITVIVLAVCWPRIPNAALRCTSPDCLTLSATYLQWMDDEVDPCSEPRRWACGKWLAENAQRLPGRPKWSLAEESRLRDLQRLRDRITTLTSSGLDSLNWKIRTLYESCVAVELVEADDKRPLENLIDQFGGWRVTRKWAPKAWTWRQVLVNLQEYGATPLFSVSVTWLAQNKTYFHLKPAGLGLPDPSFYAAGSESKPVKAYKAFLKDAALSLDATSADASFFADNVFAFESRLAKRMAEDFYKEKIFTLQELHDSAQFMEYFDMFRAIFPGVQFSHDSEVIVTAPNYITQLSSITTSTEMGILNEYFIWTLIKLHLPYMSQKFQLIWREFQFHITGSTESLPRWELCTNLVLQTTPLASLALLEEDDDIIYTRSNTTYESIQKMFEDIKNVARDEISFSSNIDGHVKSLMLEQLNGLKLQIGLSPHEKSADFMNDYYSQLYLQKHNLFANIRNGLTFERKLMQQSYTNNEISAIREISRDLIQPKAIHNSQTKTVIVPKTLVSPPYFNDRYPSAVQYARIGVLIGNVVAKALAIMDPDSDSTIPKYAGGSIYCLNGLLSNTAHWWGSKDDVSAVTGTAYLEVIGARLAIAAAQATRDYHPLLPELEYYSGDRLFALAYGQTLCSMHTSEQMLLDGINMLIDGETSFNVVWPQITGLQESLNCGIKSRCPDPL